MKLRDIFARVLPARESEIDDELCFHLDEAVKRNLARGMMPREARRQALIALGGVEKTKEECRDQRVTRLLEDLAQDVRYALRAMRKSQVFTAVAIITLALGIGANTAIFTVVNAVLLRPLPYANGDRLITIWEKQQGAEASKFRSLQPDRKELISTSVPVLEEWQAQTDLFEEVGAYSSFPARVVLTGGAEPEEILAGRVTANFFSTLGVPPLLGRGFLPGEDRLEKNNVVVLSHALWQRHFGGDRSIPGRPLVLNGSVYTVAGVMPAMFQSPGGEQAWVPAPIDAQDGDGFRGSRNMEVIARLKSGVSVGHAQAVLKAKAEVRARAFPQWSKDWTTVVVPLREHLVGDMRGRLLLLFAATVFVILIACANLANMLLARGTVRRREMALRAAIWAVDKDQPVEDIQTMDERLGGFAAMRRIYTLLLGIFSGIAVALAAVALAACYLPARRAAKVDPMLALRAE